MAYNEKQKEYTMKYLVGEPVVIIIPAWIYLGWG